MTFNEMLAILGVIREAYPRYYADKNADDISSTVKLWHEMLLEYPAKLVSYAVKNLIKSSPYPPTVADVIRQIDAVQNVNQDSYAELWEAIYNAACDSAYHAGERFAELPQICQEFVGSPRQLQDLGQMSTSELQTVTRSVFLKQAPILAERQRIREEMPDDIRLLVETIALNQAPKNTAVLRLVNPNSEQAR